MKALLTAIALGCMTLAAVASEPVPKELIGEWHNRSVEPYSGIYIRASGSATFVVASDGFLYQGGEDSVTYDIFRRKPTITFPDSAQKLFRFSFDPKNQTLRDVDGRARAFHRISQRAPDTAK